MKATENPSAYHARATAEAPVASADTPVIDVAVDSQIDARDESRHKKLLMSVALTPILTTRLYLTCKLLAKMPLVRCSLKPS